MGDEEMTAMLCRCTHPPLQFQVLEILRLSASEELLSWSRWKCPIGTSHRKALCEENVGLIV